MTKIGLTQNVGQTNFSKKLCVVALKPSSISF